MIHFKDRPLGLGNPYAPNAPCNPIAAAAVAGGLSLLGNLVGGSAQHGFTKEQQKLQSKLNREEMNHSMNLQQQYQNMVWSQGSAKEVAGMKNAGINPAGFNGPSAMSASPSTGGVGPQGPNLSNMGSDAVNAALGAANVEKDLEQKQANIDLTKAQKDKVENEAGVIGKDYENYDQRFANEMANLVEQNNQLKAGTALMGKKQEEIESSISKQTQEIENLKQSLENLRKEGTLLEHQGRLAKKQADNYDRFISAQIKSQLATAGWLNTQASNMVQSQLFNWTSASAMADYYDNESFLLRTQNQMQQWQLNMARKYGHAEWWINMIDNQISLAGDTFYKVATGVSSFMPFESRSTTQGFDQIRGNWYQDNFSSSRRRLGF